MRISSNLFFQTGLNSINAQQADLTHLFKQVGSGKRMVTPSDDPLAASQAINVSQTLAMSERYAANRQVASQNLGMQENVLNSVTLQLQDVKTRLVEAGNGTLSPVDRAALAEVLELARENLLSLANSTDGNGQFLFSGSKGDKAPFEGGQYVGDSRPRMIQVDQTRQLAGSDLGDNIFSRAAPGTVGYVTIPGPDNTGTAAVSGYSQTNTTGLAAGRGVQIEFIESSDPTDPPGTLAYRVTVPNESGVALEYEMLYPTSGGSATLLDAQLGLSVTLEGVPQIGDRFQLAPLHSPTYTVDTDGDVSDPMIRSVRGFEGQQMDLTFRYIPDPLDPLDPADPGFPSLDPIPVFTNADGVDFLASIDATTGRVSADIGAVAIEISAAPNDGQTYTISAGPGSQSREALNLFTALDDVVAALRNDVAGGTPADATNLQNALNSALQRVDVTYNNVLSVRASSGTRMNEIDALNENGSTRIMEYKNQLSKLEDVDYYTAITQLTLRTTALEAAALAFKKIQATSLFNMAGG